MKAELKNLCLETRSGYQWGLKSVKNTCAGPVVTIRSNYPGDRTRTEQVVRGW